MCPVDAACDNGHAMGSASSDSGSRPIHYKEIELNEPGEKHTSRQAREHLHLQYQPVVPRNLPSRVEDRRRTSDSAVMTTVQAGDEPEGMLRPSGEGSSS